MKSEVHNCDCIEFMKGLPDKCFSLAIADPPYGDGHGGGGYDRFAGGTTFAKYKRTPPSGSTITQQEDDSSDTKEPG